jgi:hypothetical protein
MQPDDVTEGEYRVITHPRPEADQASNPLLAHQFAET